MGGYWDHTRASPQRQPLTHATAPARSCRMGIQARRWVESNNHKEGTRNMWQQITLQPPMRSILSSGLKKQEHSHQNERRNVLSNPIVGQTQAFLESANMCQQSYTLKNNSNIGEHTDLISCACHGPSASFRAEAFASASSELGEPG